MSDVIKERAEWFVKTLKDMRQKGFIRTIYHFGYCPKCNDVTEIYFSRDSDSWTQNPPTFVVCKKCGFSSTKEVKYTGDEIPSKLRKKWDRANSRTNQIRVHKRKMREFLVSLNAEWQQRKDLYEEVSRYFGKFCRAKKMKAI